MGPLCITVAFTNRTLEAPFAITPIFHRPVGGSYVVPEVGVAFTNERPAGRRSVIGTPVASLGPLFRAVIVKLTSVPTKAFCWSTKFDTAMSDAGPALMLAVEESFEVFGSNSLPCVFVAVFVFDPV